MNFEQLLQILEEHRDSSIRIALPTGEFVPDHFHVTELGRVDKDFIDCGGVRRKSSVCSLQIWTADDLLHRLSAGKLAQIMKLAKPFIDLAGLSVEVEYGAQVAAHYHVQRVSAAGKHVQFDLVGKRTDCLAKDKCGVDECNSPGCCS